MMIATAPSEEAREPPERSETSEQYQWKLSDMYASEDAWNEHYGEIEAKIGELTGKQGTTGQSPAALLRVLRLQDQINVQMDQLYAYASHKFDQDMRQSQQQALRDRAQTLWNKYEEAKSWLEPELTKVPQETVAQWLRQDDLAIYRHYFDNLFRMKAHILSPREEALLAMASKPCNAYYQYV